MKQNKFIYLRVSTDLQDMGRQMHTINEYLKSIDESIAEYQIFQDEGVSGSVSISERSTKDILKQLKKDDLILVVDSDRLSRSFVDRINFIAVCDRLGAKIYNISKKRYITLQTNDGGIIDIIESWNGNMYLTNLHMAVRQGVENAKSKGIRFGRSSENYTVNPQKQSEGRKKASLKRLQSSLQNNEFQAFCRILKRNIKALNDSSNNEELFMLSWNKDITKNINKADLIVIRDAMIQAKEDNKELFTNFNFNIDNDYQTKLIRARIGNTMRSIEKYNELKKE